MSESASLHFSQGRPLLVRDREGGTRLPEPHDSSTVYRRIWNARTQTDETAELQRDSGEVWGRTPRWSYEPKVQAYKGPLPEGQAGIEFTTEVPPDPQALPWEPSWSSSRDDVRLEHDFAKISVTVTKVVWKHDDQDG